MKRMKVTIIRVFNMGIGVNLVLLLIIILLVKNNLSYSQSGWVQQNSGTSLNLYDIQFINDNTGYAAGGSIINNTGIILKTTNGGSSWSAQLNITNYYMQGLYFIDANTGTVVGTGPFKKTTNGGATWVNQPNSILPGARKINFINVNTGVAVGFGNLNADGGIIYTTDGGSSWVDRSFGHDAIYNDVHFFDANTGIVVGTSIIRTTNAGLNWFIVPDASGFRYAISFADVNNGMVSNWWRRIIKTTNSGSNWNLVNSLGTSTANLYGISYVDVNNSCSVGDSGLILRSTNGGINWVQQASGISSILQAVWFVNTNTGWVCGNNGVILKTTTGGITAIQPISNEIPNHFSLEQNYPNPFNPVTKIKFDIPKAMNTSLKVYDILGKEIFVIVNSFLIPGTYSFDFDGSNLPSGVYFYVLNCAGFSESKKMILIK